MTQFVLFGRFRATLGGNTLSFPTKRTAALTAYLLLERTDWQPREHIVSLLWPDMLESKGRRNLRQTLLRLRQTLPDAPNGEPPILTSGDGLRWNPAYPADVDVYRFEQVMAQAEPYLYFSLEQTPFPAISPLQDAVSLYADDLLVGFDLLSDFYTEWLESWRRRYQRQVLMAMGRLAEHYARAGLPHRVEELARRQLSISPEREIAHHQLMRAYLARGEYRAALKHYASYEQHLKTYGEQPTPALRTLQQRAKEYREQRLAHPEPVPHNLPPERTPFHGRQKELDTLLMGLVSPDVRLVTLTGLGGIGKTRLALTAARHFIRPLPDVSPRYPDGVWFVSLAEVLHGNDETLAQAVLTACNVQPFANKSAFQSLVQRLKENTCLLILDNLEHIADAPAFVARLLHELPHLNILATSRHPLKLQQEMVLKLKGLPVPADTGNLGVPSMRLLIERLQWVTGTFSPTPDTHSSLVRICNALEGWPLALELVASWGEQLPLEQIANHVTRSISAIKTSMPDVLPRHRSIEAVLESSVALLTPTQQRVFRQFAIFHGGCTADAAEAISGASQDDLSALVRSSLLQQQNGRYFMHELVRQFAQRKLDEQKEEPVSCARAHAQYYLSQLVLLEKDLFGPHPFSAVQKARSEWENLRSAWNWAIEFRNLELLAAARPALTRIILFTGLLQEGKSWMEAALPMFSPPLSYDFIFPLVHLCINLAEFSQAHTLLESLPEAENLSLAQQYDFHLNWGRLLEAQGFYTQAQQHRLQAFTLARSLTDRRRLIESLSELIAGEHPDEAHVTELAALLDEIDDLWLKKEGYNILGSVRIRQGQYQQALSFWQKALHIALELENGVRAAVLYNNLGDALRELGYFEQADAAFQKSLEFSQKARYERSRKYALEGFSRLCVLRGEYKKAIKLAQESIALSARTEERHVELTAWNCLGHAYVGLKNWSKAESAYRRALALANTRQETQEALAGLAYVRFKLGNKMEARAYINRFLDTLWQRRMPGYASPSWAYTHAVEVLQGVGESAQAERLLKYVRKHLKPALPAQIAHQQQENILY